MVVVSLNACKSDPSYDHKFPLSIPIFSNSLEYIMSHELSLSIRIRETYKFLIIAIMTKGNISLGVPITFS